MLLLRTFSGSDRPVALARTETQLTHFRWVGSCPQLVQATKDGLVYWALVATTVRVSGSLSSQPGEWDVPLYEATATNESLQRFQVLLTLSSDCFSTFDRSTCALSVLRQY